MQNVIFKRWRWAVGGLVLGLAIAWWRGYVGLDSSLLDRDTLDVTEFEKMLVAKSPTGQPLLKDIRFYGHENGTDWVIAQRFTRRGQGSDRSEGYIPVKIGAQRPYQPTSKSPAKADSSYTTVIDYLKSLQATNPQVRFSSRWWDREPTRSMLYALVGMIALAGAGPFVLELLSGGTVGMGRGGRDEKEYDLSRFGKGGSSSSSSVTTKRGPSESDMAHLRELEAELERRLAGNDIAETPAGASSDGSSPSSQGAAPVKKLDAGPLEPPPAEQKPKQQKEYGGEFYPTETHVKRHQP